MSSHYFSPWLPKSTQGRMSHLNSSLYSELLARTSTTSPKRRFHRYYQQLPNNLDIRKELALTTTHHNIAVQTEVEGKVQDQLKAVDENIERRLESFELDLRSMREQLAKALRDKERLIAKLARLESKPVEAIEDELKEVKSYTKVPIQVFEFPKQHNGKLQEKLKNGEKAKESPTHRWQESPPRTSSPDISPFSIALPTRRTDAPSPILLPKKLPYTETNC